MKIEHIEISKLINYEHNAKLHPKKQIEQIAKSINEFGFLTPVLIDDNNIIIAGHGRVQAAKKLNIIEIPCVKISHLTEMQKKAFIIADNKLNMNTGFDQDILQREINSILNDEFLNNFDFDSIGFNIDEIDNIKENIEINIINKKVDYTDFIDNTQERKADQEDKKPVKYQKCPSCGHEWSG